VGGGIGVSDERTGMVGSGMSVAGVPHADSVNRAMTTRNRNFFIFSPLGWKKQKNVLGDVVMTGMPYPMDSQSVYIDFFNHYKDLFHIDQLYVFLISNGYLK
jgi:hypothetical protein